MKFRFTKHALARCRQRGIKVKDVKLAVQSAEKVKIVEGGAIEAKKKIRKKTLVVIFEAHRDLRKIITAYYED